MIPIFVKYLLAKLSEHCHPKNIFYFKLVSFLESAECEVRDESRT